MDPASLQSLVRFRSNFGHWDQRKSVRFSNRYQCRIGLECLSEMNWNQCPNSPGICRATADSSDENLEAKTPGGGGRVKKERKPLNRRILDAPDATIQSNLA